jgi:hypothetical protein
MEQTQQVAPYQQTKDLPWFVIDEVPVLPIRDLNPSFLVDNQFSRIIAAV